MSKPLQGRTTPLAAAQARVYSAPPGEGRNLHISLQAPAGVAGLYRATALVEVRMSGPRGTVTRSLPVSCIKGSALMMEEAGTRGGFSLSIPEGMGLEVLAKWVWAPPGAQAPDLNVQVLPQESPLGQLSLGPVAGAPLPLPVYGGAGSGPWLDLGCLPYGLTRVSIMGTPNECFFRAITADEVETAPITLLSSGRLTVIDPFPAYLFIQARTQAATVDPSFVAIAWS